VWYLIVGVILAVFLSSWLEHDFVATQDDYVMEFLYGILFFLMCVFAWPIILAILLLYFLAYPFLS